MARTKTTVARSRQQGHSRSTPTKNTRSQKRKDRDPSPDTPKRKKLNQEEPIEVSDSDESDDFIPDQNFHHGTTWPLDASLEVQVTYEGVKEVRSIKQQFFPLLFHLTRGEPENIAKAIAAIKPVYKILSDRFEKESKPLDNRSTNIQALKSKAESSKPVVSSSKSDESSSKPAVSSSKPVVSRAEILKKLPHHHFRDAEGKWLPKKQWKIAEILKDNTKVQSILSGEASQISGTEKITELGYAKSAIRNILSRVSLKRPLYVNLFMWMKKLDMNSFENPQLPRKREKQKAKKKTEKKVEKRKEVKKNSSNASKMILYGLEESAIIPDKRLRSKPKFIPFIRPNQKTSKTDGKTQSLLKKRTTSYTPYSAAMKNYVQKSGNYAQKSRFSGSFKEQSGSSRGFSVLFKGRTFSSGKKILFNRNQSFQSGSDSESESDSSSTSSSLAQDGGMIASRSLEPQQTGPKTKVCSSAGRNAKRKSPRTISQSNSSRSCKSEKYVLYSDVNSSEDDAEDNPPVVKSPTVRLPRIDIQRLSDSVVKSLSSPKKDKQHEMHEVRGSMDSSSKILEKVESASSSPSPQDDMLGIRITDVKSLTDQEERLFDNKEMETDDKIQNLNEGQGNSEKKSDEAETGNVSKGASEVNNTTASKKVVHVVLEEEELQLPDIEVNEREVDGMENSQKEAGMDGSLGAVEQSRNKGDSSQDSPSVVQWKNAESGSRSARQTQGKGVRGQEKGPSPDSTDVQNVKYNDIATGSTQSDKPTGSTSSSSSTTTNTQETLRSLINQLTSLTSDSLDCKIIFSNSNQVLTIGEGRKGSVRERNMDIKPNVDQLNLRVNPQIPDSNNGTSSGSSKQGNHSGAGNPRLDLDVRGENPTVPNVQVKEERQWVGLGNQTETDAIIIIDSDDE